jgi:hypothetical protein
MVRPDGTFRSFSFSARKYADGSVEGQLQLNSRGFDVFVHIEIDCLRVVENKCRFAEVRTTNSELPRWTRREYARRSRERAILSRLPVAAQADSERNALARASPARYGADVS